jgi:uncharacterized protein (DUF1778 family)
MKLEGTAEKYQKKNSRSSRMSVPITAEQRDWLRAASKKEMRTMTQHVRWLIQRAMDHEKEIIRNET